MSKNVIPPAVIDASKERASLGVGKLALVGHLNDSDVYSYKFDEPLTIGMPELYLWDGSTVSVLSGFEAEEALGSISFSS